MRFRLRFLRPVFGGFQRRVARTYIRSPGKLTGSPPVRITSVGDLATIDHTQDLTIRWNGTDYGNGYTATIELFSSNNGVMWAPTDQRTINYASLRAGSYTFRCVR